MTLRPRSKVIGNVGQSPITSSKKKKRIEREKEKYNTHKKKWAQKKWRQLFGFFSHLFRLSRSDNSAEKWRRHFSAKSHPSLPLATPPSRSHRKQVHGYANEVRAVFFSFSSKFMPVLLGVARIAKDVTPNPGRIPRECGTPL